MSGMDCLIGFTGKGFAILAADGNAARSIMVCSQEPDYFKKNMDLYLMRNGVPLTTQAAANYMRGEKSYNLRRQMSVVDMLLAGYDEADGPSLYFLDYLASMQKLDKAAHGYGGFFVNSLLDAHWRPDLSEAEALDLLECCFAEIQKRFMVAMPKFTIKVVDANGVRVLERKAK